jgi:hypothetical protein
MTWTLTGNAQYQPLSLRTSLNNNLVAWNGDPAFVPGSPGLSAGFIYMTRAYVDQSLAANTAYMGILTAGTGCTNCFIGIYDPATGNRLAQTADVSTQMMTVALLQVALTSTLAAQALNQELWLAVLMGATTGTPTIVGRSPYGNNIGQSSDYRFQLSSTGSHTSLPSTVPTLVPATASQAMPFIGIGP